MADVEQPQQSHQHLSKKRALIGGITQKKPIPAAVVEHEPVASTPVKKSAKTVHVKLNNARELRAKAKLYLNPTRVSRIAARQGLQLRKKAKVAFAAAVQTIVKDLIQGASVHCRLTSRLGPSHIRKALYHNPHLRQAIGNPIIMLPEAGHQQTAYFGMDLHYYRAARQQAAQEGEGGAEAEE